MAKKYVLRSFKPGA